MAQISSHLRGVIARIVNEGHADRVALELRLDLQDAGLLVTGPHGAYAVTDKGRDVAATEIARDRAAKNRKNAAARGRSNAMRSIGMVRTPYGWE
jgi:hypothetical protein